MQNIDAENTEQMANVWTRKNKNQMEPVPVQFYSEKTGV